MNKVICEGDEMKIVNIRNRKKAEEEKERERDSGWKKGTAGKKR